MSKVAVAMSGGIDSSVTALLLKKQGYDVVGVTGKMLNCKASDIICNNAKNVADRLGIEHFILDVSDTFKAEVIDYFENSYFKGETPNPCIMCNKFLKWGKIFDYSSNELGADLFATGHYADIKCQNGVYKLYPAQDVQKDQLYFLYKLNQYHLSKTLFPLFKYKKNEIVKMAIEYDLPSKDSKESQDICFINKPLTTKKYLIEKFGIKKGDFIEIGSGKKLGEHDGHYLYTIGQRKGIGISAPKPLYVIDIDAEKNIVYLGYEEINYKSRLALKDVNFTYDFKEKEFDALVKIRYNMEAKKAKCNVVDDLIEVTFYEPVSSITSGQAGVLYDTNEKYLIGGGIVI